jgi:hypothetical protein
VIKMALERLIGEDDPALARMDGEGGMQLVGDTVARIRAKVGEALVVHEEGRYVGVIRKVGDGEFKITPTLARSLVNGAVRGRQARDIFDGVQSQVTQRPPAGRSKPV